mmetsp:Transcript_11624/g.15506  ORF Transcript_11624/g.15506 Transcript_11624/m.15506 type:complete len:140 (+) Transcript_11624:289-708(+)
MTTHANKCNTAPTINCIPGKGNGAASDVNTPKIEAYIVEPIAATNSFMDATAPNNAPRSLGFAKLANNACKAGKHVQPMAIMTMENTKEPGVGDSPATKYPTNAIKNPYKMELDSPNSGTNIRGAIANMRPTTTNKGPD